MNRARNPYPEFFIDEVSGIEIRDIRHKIWAEGYEAGRRYRGRIKNVIRTPEDMVLVFDKRGEQIPEYQGQYQAVRAGIVEDAPPGAVFAYALADKAELQIMTRCEW